MRTIPCDKVAIAKVMWGLIKAKLDHLRITNQTDAYRKWCAVMPHVMEGLTLPEEAAAFMPTSVEDFLQLYRFKSANSEEGKHGWRETSHARAAGTAVLQQAGGHQPRVQAADAQVAAH